MANRGFTLIELLVVMAISGLVLGSVLAVFMSTNKTYTIQDQKTNLQQEVRAALSIMLKDMRMAGLNPTQNSAMQPIVTATATHFGFNTDYEETGNATLTEYQYDAGQDRLEWQENGGGFQMMADSITNLEFVYGSTSEGMTSSPANLNDIRNATVTLCGEIRGAYSDEVNARQIRTTLANGTVQTDQAADFCLTRSVYFRNLGL